MSQEKTDRGLRYNTGKARFDLLPVNAVNELTAVMTRGASKYAPRNWEKGMPWTEVLASLERHLQAFKAGEDYDPESSLKHMAHVMANASFLTEYYTIYPEGDDRPHSYLKKRKVGLDIDDVLADFCTHWMARFGTARPKFWNFDSDMKAHIEEVQNDEEFWLNVPMLNTPDDLPFEPHCYITSRSIPSEVTKKWLDKNNYPTVPLYSVGINQSKVEVAKMAGIDYFVDDKFENFRELNEAGICCFLYTRPHNERYNVGHKRIYSLSEVLKW